MTPPSGRIAGRYRLQGLARRGGQGALWSAIDERTGATVGVRLLERGADESARVAHFRASALASARLEHPSIVQVLDEGHDPVGPFVITEWVDGIRLSEWRAARPPWGFVRPVIAQLCDALAHVHARGLVHLDLRPSSVLVVRGEAGPVVRLSDVGCARLDEGFHDREAWARATLKYLGTLRYIAPEAADSPPWRVGAWSDLYGVGLLLWELLAGALPFEDSDGMALLLRRASEAPPPLPPELGGAYGPSLRALLSRLLARDPLDRPHSAAQVRRTVEALDAPPIWSEPLRPRGERWPASERRLLTVGAFPLVPLREGPLVSRDAALHHLWAGLQAAVTENSARVIFLAGPAGFGKSRLVGTLAEHAGRTGAARPWVVEFGPGPLGAGGLAGALEDLLRAGRADAEGIADRVAALPLLAGADSDGFEIALPGLLRPDPTAFAALGHEPDPSLEAEAADSAEMLAAAFLALLERVTQNEAVLLVLEDAQHAPETEAPELIERLLRQADQPVCVVVTLRDDAPRTASLRARFPEGERVRWVGLDPPDEHGLRYYASRRLQLAPALEDDFVRAVTQWPGALGPIADWLLDGQLMAGADGSQLVPGALLPEDQSELFGGQLARLPATGPDALVPDVITGLALSHVPLSPRVIDALIADDPHRPYARALLAAERARLVVRRTVGGWRFQSAELVAWLTARAGDRAGSWHRRWMRGLERLEGDARGILGVERAAHADALGDLPRAITAMLEAAAWTLGASQPSLRRGLAAARRAESLAEAVGDRLSASRAARLRGELLHRLGEAEAARAGFYDAEGWLAPIDAPVDMGWCTLARSWLDLRDGASERAGTGFADAFSAFGGANDDGGMLWTMVGRGRVALAQGRAGLARRIGREVEEGFEGLGARRGVLAARLLRAQAAEASRDWELAERRYAALQEDADARRWLVESVTLRIHRARVALGEQRVHDALNHLETARGVSALLRLSRLESWVSAVRPAALAASGDSAAAREALSVACLPPARLGTSAARAIESALACPTVQMDQSLLEALRRWAKQVAEHAYAPRAE